MASTSSFFYLPSNINNQPITVSKVLKTKRRSYPSFFITDILGNHNRSPSPDHKTHLLIAVDKHTGKIADEDDTILHNSDDNGKCPCWFALVLNWNITAEDIDELIMKVRWGQSSQKTFFLLFFVFSQL